MGKKVDEENLFTTSAQFEETSGVTTEGGTDMAAVTDITDESLARLPEQENGAIDESAAMTDIDSMDSDALKIFRITPGIISMTMAPTTIIVTAI